MRAPGSPGAQITIGSAAFVGADPAGGPLSTLAGANITVGSGSYVGNVETTTPAMPLTGLAGVIPNGTALHETTPTSLTPGNYGALTVEATTVTLMPGSFTFTAIRLQGVGATLTTSGPGSVTVVTNSVATDTHSTIKPASGYTASDLTIFTADSTVLEGSTRALVVAHDIVEVAGSFTGAIAASRIALHNATTVNFEDGINIAASTGSQQLSGYYANQDTYCVTNELSPHQTMTLAFALPLPDPTGLESFIADRSDPTSPNYRQWFADVAAFKAANYAPSDSDYAALEAWATANGLTIVETIPTNMLLTVSGTVAAFEAALHARLYFRDNGTTQGFIAPDREPSLDLGPSLRWIAGLDNWSPPGPADCGKSPLAQDFTSSAGIVGALSASDFRQAYLGTDSACRAFDGTALDGTGQTVAIYDENVVIDIPTERTGYINMQPIGTTGVFTGSVIHSPLSAATPLWAGFTAVANQLSALKSIPQIGYANPVLYGVGKSSASNTVFHDAADGVFNQEPIPNLFSLGHPAVVGYDLATGWGSFSCPLMQALGGPARTELWVRVENGNDGLNDQTSVDLTVSTTTTPFTVNLKAENETGWSDGGLIHDKVIPLDAIVRPEDITGVTVTMNENGQGGLTADNWDIGGIQISLISASTDTSTPMACLVDLSGNGNCNETQAGSNVQPSCQPAGTLGNTSDTGVARLSENDDDSGQGPTASFSVSASNTGCPPWSNTVSAQPFGAYEIIVDTTDDGMNAGSLATFTILDHVHTGGVAATGGLTGPTPDRFEFATGASVFSGDDNLSQLGDSSNNVLEIDFSPSSGDNWVVNGFTVVGRPAGGTGPDTCIMRWTGSALFTGTDPQFFPLSGCQ